GAVARGSGRGEGLRQGRDDRVGHLVGLRSSADVAGANPAARGGFEGSRDSAGLIMQTEVIKHQSCAGNRTDRVGDALAGDVGGRSVNWLEHAGEATFRVQVGTGRDAEASGERGAEIRKDVGVEVGGHDYRQVLRM